MREKLELLCRELQKQNKTIVVIFWEVVKIINFFKEESKKIAEDEQTKRNELSKKFHETIERVTLKMDEQAEERLKLVNENGM